MFYIYWLINEDKDKTYVGFSENIKEGLKQHSDKQVKTTKSFGKFKSYVLEKVENLEKARIREKYWKSSSGRRRLKKYFKYL